MQNNAMATQYLCYHCVGESYLSNEIKDQGKRRRCSYCNQIAQSYDIDQLAERIDAVFDQHFIRTPEQPTWEQSAMLADKDSDYEWERDGQPVVYAIMDAAEIPEEAARDIQAVLRDQNHEHDAEKVDEESPYADDSHYKEKRTDDWRWQEAWQDFELSLKTETRF